jgi:hypothetical protein
MSAAQPTPPPLGPKIKVVKPRTLVNAVGRADPAEEARRAALAIFEVLAGIRTTADAAKALSISLPRYYALEARAVEGLIRACEPRKPGKRRSPSKELESLRREMQRLERECARQQALARAAQRTLGLASIGAKKTSDRSGKEGEQKRRRERRPRARALVAARALQRPAAAGGVVTSADGALHKPKS